MNKATQWILVIFMAFMLFGAWRAYEVDKAKGQPVTVQMQNLLDNAKTDNNMLNKNLSNKNTTCTCNIHKHK